jgi:hypothetical protein
MPLPLLGQDLTEELAQRGNLATNVLSDLDALNHRQRHMVLGHSRSLGLRLISVQRRRTEKLSTALGELDIDILVWITARDDADAGHPFQRHKQHAPQPLRSVPESYVRPGQMQQTQPYTPPLTGPMASQRQEPLHSLSNQAMNVFQRTRSPNTDYPKPYPPNSAATLSPGYYTTQYASGALPAQMRKTSASALSHQSGASYQVPLTAAGPGPILLYGEGDNSSDEMAPGQASYQIKRSGSFRAPRTASGSARPSYEAQMPWTESRAASIGNVHAATGFHPIMNVENVGEDNGGEAAEGSDDEEDDDDSGDEAVAELLNRWTTVLEEGEEIERKRRSESLNEGSKPAQTAGAVQT